MQDRQNYDAKRRIVIAFKTTGHKPEKGDRMTELACVEMMGLEKTGNNLQTFLYPGDDLIGKCANEYRNCPRLRNTTRAAEYTAVAMNGVPGFLNGGGADMLMEQGAAEFLVSEVTQAPLFPGFEDELMEYLRMHQDTVIITHDMGRLKRFLKAEMSEENWKEFSENYGDPKHGMMQKSHKFRPAGLFPDAPGRGWVGGLDFDAICNEFDVSVRERTHYSAMQDALMLAEVVPNRKEMKMDNLELFPDSKANRIMDTSTEEMISTEEMHSEEEMSSDVEVSDEILKTPMMRR